MAKNNSKNTNTNNNVVNKTPTGFKTSSKVAPTPKKQQPEPVVEPQKKAVNKKQIVLVSAIVLLAIVVGVVAGVLVAALKKPLDFYTADLSRYITISESDYKNYTLDIPTDSLRDFDLQRQINILLCENKGDVLYDGGFYRGKPLTVGAVAYLWYRGYTVDENGKETDFAGGSNFGNESTVVEIGSGNILNRDTLEVEGQMIPGFSDALIGITSTDYPKFDRILEGGVQRGDVIYLTYSVIRPDGTYDSMSQERIDLSDPDLETKMGEGFADLFYAENVKIGEKMSFITVDDEGNTTEADEVRVKWNGKGDAIYYDMTVTYLTRCETENKLTIDVTFPADYGEESLRGVHTKFDIYVDYAAFYNLPTYDESFITETLKLTADDLKDYKGETLVDKHNAKLIAKVEKEIHDSNLKVLEEAMWKHYKTKVTVKRLPKKTVKTYYDNYYAELEATYASYVESYDTLDKFAIAYYNLAPGADWRGHMQKQAEEVTVEKLIFYYIMREENLFPSEAEYTKRYNEIYNEYLDYYLELNKADFEKLEGEEYQKELDILKAEIDDYYGEEYFRESVYYNYAIEIMVSYASLTK